MIRVIWHKQQMAGLAHSKVRYILNSNWLMFSINLSRSKSRSISPSKSVTRLNTTRSSNNLNRSHLYELPKIPSYYKINRPSFSQHMKNNIEQKLNFQKAVKSTLQVRQKNQDHFLKFKDNPFCRKNEITELQHSLSMQNNLTYKQTTQKPTSFYEKKRNKVYQNVIDAVNDLRTKNTVVKDKTLAKIKTQALNFSHDLKQKTKHLAYSFKKQQLERKKTQFVLKEKSFDQIVNMEEQSFYIQHQPPINIFSVIKARPKLLNCSILDNYRFSYTSVIEKAEQKKRLPLYRDLSRKARLLTLKINKFSKQDLMQFISSSDINSNTSRIRFEDLMGLASGRCTSELIDDWINNGEISYDFEEAIKDEGQTLKENRKNFGAIKIQPDENMREVGDWKQRKSSAYKKYAEKCEKVRNMVVSQMGKKVNLTKKTVADKKTHVVLSSDIKDSILYFLNMDRYQKENLYRNNGSNGQDKTSLEILETIKLDNLIQTTRHLKKSYQQIEKLCKLTDRL